jgi:hypothetical protein
MLQERNLLGIVVSALRKEQWTALCAYEICITRFTLPGFYHRSIITYLDDFRLLRQASEMWNTLSAFKPFLLWLALQTRCAVYESRLIKFHW